MKQSDIAILVIQVLILLFILQLESRIEVLEKVLLYDYEIQK